MPQLSIIIPVYNTEKYLHRCIDSVLLQSFTDYELLLIDDGSTDGSGTICDEYAAIDARIRVVHRSNYGVSATREFALSQATGEFIQFIDSDDWIDSTMLQKMYNEAQQKDADIVCCCFDLIFDTHTTPYRLIYKDKISLQKAIIGNCFGVLWKNLIRRDVIISNDIHFDNDLQGGEDYCFMVKAITASSVISTVDEILYHYNKQNQNSIMAVPTLDKVLSQIKATEMVISFLADKKLLSTFEDALIERKIFAKNPLFQFDKDLWYRTFPEVNKELWKRSGKRKKIIMPLLWLKSKLKL